MGLLKNQSVGIDLGTMNVRIFVKGKGIVLREPTVVAVDRSSGEMLAVGKEAQAMIGGVPGKFIVVRPLKDGVISSFDHTEMLLRHFLHRAIGRRPLLKPKVTVCIPSGVTEVERMALIDVTEESGARQVRLIEDPIAAAIGAGMDIDIANGKMIIDIGAGRIDVAVISLGRMIVNESSKVGGAVLDESIIKYVKKKYNILIGDKTSSDIKINIGSAIPRKKQVKIEVAGRNLESGLPEVVILDSSDASKAFEEPLNAMLETIGNVLEVTPPELTSDIVENGVCLTGGGALLYGIDSLISEKTGLSCYVADDAISCVAIGTGMATERSTMDLQSNK
jgi:rod shape-determining protein MreB and related proteins